MPELATPCAFVRVGTLDEPDRLPPDIHIFTASKQRWVILPADKPAVPEYYDRQPALAGREPGSACGRCASERPDAALRRRSSAATIE